MSSNNSMTRSNPETKGITAVLILEIIGRPPEHLVETLKQIVGKMGEEKGVVINKHKIHDPHELKDKKDFFTTFVEIEVEVEEILYLAMLMFKYMPAHIEVIEPELIALTNNGWNDIMNELTRRLHGYDEIARVMQMENSMMKKKLEEIIEAVKKKEEKKKKGAKKSAKKKVVKKKVGKKK